MYSYSPKQEEVVHSFLNDNSFINILEGSVRSGKTFIANFSWALYVLQSPYDAFLMSGESTDSLYRNAIKDIISILGEKRARYNENAKGGAQLIIYFNGMQKICYCRGGSKSNDEGKIRGATLGGWYADEITLHHKTFVNQALARLSLEGAKAIWTTNPDSPFHFIKKDYIDMAEQNGYNHWHFNLDDNLTLSESYKENIKKAYSGVFYDRFIKGLWVLADGIIYSMFNKDKNIVPTIERQYIGKKYVAVDYGTLNPTTFGLYAKDREGIWYKVKEYHHSGRETKVQKTDEQYANDLEEFMNYDKDIEVIVDPSASSFITALRNRGITVIQGNNDVLDGIRLVSVLIENGEILFNDCNTETFKELETYIWDEKASAKGDDIPVKENDHHLDGLRYFVATILKYQIENKYFNNDTPKGRDLSVLSKPIRRKGGSVF